MARILPQEVDECRFMFFDRIYENSVEKENTIGRN